jgi:lipopolysaccharide export system protein LptC
VGKSHETISGMTRLFPKKKQVLTLLFLIILAGGAGGVYLIHERMTAPLRITDLHVDSDAALKLDVMKQISKKNGITEWELEAATATLVKEQNQAILTQVHVVFHTRTDDTVILRSDQGILDTQTHDMDFTGNVVVTYQRNTLKTDKLHYKKKPHIIFSQTKVWLENPDAAMEADTMEIRINDNKIILQGHVKGKFSENFYLP